MKTKTKFKIGGFVIILLVSVWSWTQRNEKQSELLLFNVEALANGELGNVDCVGTGSVVCPLYGDKVYVVFQ